MFIDQIVLSLSLLLHTTIVPVNATNQGEEQIRSAYASVGSVIYTNYRSNSKAKAKSAALNLQEYYAQQLVNLPIRLRPGTDHRKDSRPTIDSARRCRSIVYQTYTHLPAAHTQTLKELTLYYTNDGRRGLGGSDVMVIRCLNVGDAELASVFTHEMGHIVDGGYLKGSTFSRNSEFSDFGTAVKSDDPSVAFYRLNWANEKKLKSTAREIDFVSTYAMSDPFEDFSETYMFYRLHGGTFRYLALTSPVLAAKYDFMRTRVFMGMEYGSDTVIDFTDTENRQYDATVIPFNLQSFFNEPRNYF